MPFFLISGFESVEVLTVEEEGTSLNTILRAYNAWRIDKVSFILIASLLEPGYVCMHHERGKKVIGLLLVRIR